MKCFALFVALTIGATCWTHASWADLDHLCLNQCVNKGGAIGSCITGCSYGQNSAPISVPAGNTLSSHRVLDTPVVAKDVVLPTNEMTPSAPDKDYTSFNQCLHQGNAYGLCERNCSGQSEGKSR